MRIILTIFISFLGVTCFAQNSTADPVARENELFRAYGFCYGQQRSIAQIKTDYPSFQAEMRNAEAEFELIFGKSCKSISELFSIEVKQQLSETFEAVLRKKVISFEDASRFVTTVKKRAKGEIESPVKETLLSFNPLFENQPALEFTGGFTKTFSTLGHEKSKGLNLEFKVPFSWNQREGSRPHIVQFFKAKFGRSDPYLTILIDEFSLPKGLKVRPKDMSLLFSQKNLKNFIPADAVLLESKPITLEGQKGGMWVYEIKAQRLDLTIVSKILQYSIVYKNKMVSLQFATGGKLEDREKWTSDFEKNLTLFRMIANSLVLVDNY